MRLDVVLLPPQNISDEIGKQARKLRKFSLISCVDNKHLFPHVTLFQFQANRNNLDKIFQKVGAISEYFADQITLTSTGMQSDRGYVVFGLKKNKVLYKLHELVVKTVSPLRIGRWKNYSLENDQKIKLLKKYGHHNIFQFFNPHITVARAKSEKNIPKMLSAIYLKSITFHANRIAVTEVDENSQVVRILKVFTLGNPIERACEVIKSGGVVVYPTDTSYGLAVDATNIQAVKKLYQLKGRGFHKPIHIIPPNKSTVGLFARISPLGQKVIDKFMPGPITLVLPVKSKNKSLLLLSACTKKIGIRIPKNIIALDLVAKLGRPITATSANVSGQADCYAIKDVKKQFEQKRVHPDYYLDSGKLKKTRPSTVIKIGKEVELLRQGPITSKTLEKVLKIKINVK